MSQPLGVQATSVFKSPAGPPGKWTMGALRYYLQTALMIEKCTIPLYLYALYSIDVTGSEDEQEAIKDISTIVKQEMLHLALVGNILTSVYGRPRLYGDPYVPTFPSEILYEGVPMELAPATQEQIQNFAQLEQPTTPPPHVPFIFLSEYKSIGQFYGGLKSGLKALHDQARVGVAVFDKTSVERQWIRGDSFGDLEAIDNLDTPIKKLTLVIEQGEGSTWSTKNSH
ncbi:hypothetical protein FRC11_013156 [Ceratobasidium sp. 423]|nr:hypothetical protein FRC11_013156 [Ceratobasidium sp. 423]